MGSKNRPGYKLPSKQAICRSCKKLFTSRRHSGVWSEFCHAKCYWRTRWHKRLERLKAANQLHVSQTERPHAE